MQQRSYTLKFPPLNIYLDDLQVIGQLLSESGFNLISIRTNDYAYETLTEFINNKEDRKFTYASFEFANKVHHNIALRLTKYTFEVSTYKMTPEIRGLIELINERLLPRKDKMRNLMYNFPIYISFLATATLVILIKTNIKAPLIPFLLLLLLLGFFIIAPLLFTVLSHSTIYFKKSDEAQNFIIAFLYRKKDDLIMNIIVAIITFILSFLFLK